MPPKWIERPCGCSPYLGFHADNCPETPLFAQLCQEHGGNPADAFPFLVFSLISHGRAT